MDSLVAQYSRPSFQNEGNDEIQQEELFGPTPGLSLKFAMPPVAQVRQHLQDSELLDGPSALSEFCSSIADHQIPSTHANTPNNSPNNGSAP
jgi:hypothetical protein